MRARHSPRPRWIRLLAFGLVAGLLTTLVACSGGGDGIRISAATATTDTTDTTTASATATVEATPTPLPVPARPEDPFAGGRLVEAYLAEGEPDIEGCLPEVVAEWGMAPEVDGARCALLDLDGDGEDEFIFLVSMASGADDTSPYPADLWFFEDEGEDYRFFNSARALANAGTSALRIRGTDDLSGDGLPDIVLTWDECGANTCVTHLTIASYHNGLIENLGPEDAAIESLEAFTIEGGAITMRGGLIGSVGAGPQREQTRIVTWAGSRFRTETIEGPPVYLVHLVNDADRLYDSGDYAAAEQAYLDAAADNTLPDWKAEVGVGEGQAELRAYSTFRAAIATFKQSDLLNAGRLLERTATQYRDTMHGSAALEYLIALSDGDTPEESCEAAEGFLESVQQRYTDFWNYGYANPTRDIFTLCR